MFKGNKIILLLIAIATVIQLMILKSLDYSISYVTWNYSSEILDQSPKPNFEIGYLIWDVEDYSKNESMTPFRTFFNDNCYGLEGIEAASCLSENFIKRVPFGEPSSEIFDANFNPVENFNDKLNGNPGHCVSYASMTVDTLLSVGIPARYIQILPKNKDGHNLIEVWDKKYGWVVFDSLSDSLISDGNKFLSAIEAHTSQTPIKRVEANPKNPTVGYLTDYYEGENPFDNAIIYPDPWIYTRTAKKENFIYRYNFIGFGDGAFYYSYFQFILRFGILLCLVAFFIILSIDLKKKLFK